jgi:hypothetical protein
VCLNTTKSKHCKLRDGFNHKPNLAKNIVGGGGGAKSTMVIRNFTSQVRRREKIGLNQPLIYIHPFPQFSPKFFYLPLFNSVTKKKKKNYS